MYIKSYKLSGMLLMLGLFILSSSSGSANSGASPPKPVSWWNLDRYEVNHVTGRVTGIHDEISRRFHYTRNASGELIRYPTHVRRKAKSAPKITGAFTVEAWVAPQQHAPHWNPVFDQGINMPTQNIDREKRHPGLVGTKFGGIELSRVVDEDPIFLDGFDKDWSDGDNGWSGRWRGYLKAPYTGKVKFTAEADDGVRLKIGDRTVIDGWGRGEDRTGEISMEKGKFYPVVVEYYRDGGDSYLRLFWEWNEGSGSQIPLDAVFHTNKEITLAEKEIDYQPVSPDEKTRLSFGISPEGKPAIKMNLDGSVETFYCEKSIPLETWSHIAVSCNGNETGKFFINGEQAGSFELPSELIPKEGGDLYIGKSHREQGKPYSLKEFTGIVGSTRLYDESISQNTIHTTYQENRTDYERPAEAVEPFRHINVYDEPGRYAGWPANGGMWQWDDEIAVAFEVGWFDEQPDAMDGHAKDDDKSNVDFIARSKDGGETWTYKEYPMLDPPEDSIKPFTGSMEFTHPDFAFKSFGSRFYYSYNRGKTWKGPFQLSVEGVNRKLSARTDYLVEDDTTAYFFFSVEPKGKEDRAFCAYTDDGGQTLQFRGWMTDPSPEPWERWVMPSTIQLSGTHLISALRRKINIRRDGKPDSTRNWIDVYQSADDGRSWKFLSKVAQTGKPNNPYNGNPPSMIRLDDGRLCVTYAVRDMPGRLCARISSDNGKTWGKEIILRQDARNWDIGYTRSVQRPDGQVLTVYYFATPGNRNQFIAATIWDPDVKFAR
ncbi:MAG: LamG-like jellyroll fold domain-containing protein [Bacteroidales bacterium]